MPLTKAQLAMTIPERFMAYVQRDQTTECWLWNGPMAGMRREYGEIKQNGVRWQAHRRAWDMFRGPIPSGASVLHKCDRPACVNPDHLFLGSQADNMADMARKQRGRGKRSVGENHPNSRLTENDVRIIRSDHRSCTAIAREYGVSIFCISAVKRRVNWRHVD